MPDGHWLNGRGPGISLGPFLRQAWRLSWNHQAQFPQISGKGKTHQIGDATRTKTATATKTNPETSGGKKKGKR